MRVYLDDERLMPEGFDIHVKTAEEAIKLIDTGQVTKISLDHDLGENRLTGYSVACHIEQLAYNRSIPQIELLVHSQNPVGICSIKAAFKNCVKFWQSEPKNQ